MTNFDLGPNADLIGQPGSRYELQTPALVIDLDVLERNLDTMRTFLLARGIYLRPHTKTHKSVQIAKLQIEHGAVGVCCTTLGEAEILVAGGVPSVHVTSPVVGNKIKRLIDLAKTAEELSVVVDDVENAENLSDAASQANIDLSVLVDVDLGRRRTGVPTGEGTVELAGVLNELPGLNYRGYQAYDGRLQHVYDLQERFEKSEVVNEILVQLAQALNNCGLTPEIATGGGTGSLGQDAAAHVFTDLQCGSYLFMDADYNLVDYGDDAPTFETSLFVATRVVSRQITGQATVDAGIKSLATDGKMPTVAEGAPPETSYAFAGDEHGIISWPDEEQQLGLASLVWLVTSHCDPTVNLHDRYHCVCGDRLVDIWPVDTRGRSA